MEIIVFDTELGRDLAEYVETRAAGQETAKRMDDAAEMITFRNPRLGALIAAIQAGEWTEARDVLTNHSLLII